MGITGNLKLVKSCQGAVLEYLDGEEHMQASVRGKMHDRVEKEVC